MKKVSKYKVEWGIFLSLILLLIVSIVTIDSATTILPSYMSNLVLRQIMWYGIGFLLVYLIMYLGNSFIYRSIWILYVLGIISLIGLLLFAEPINHARCWFSIPGIGTIQPSEFMKIILILVLGSMIHQFHLQYSSPSVKDEFFFLLKVGLVVAVPSFLTFLQPDTGVVLIYLLITIVMLFVSGIRYRWFFLLFGIFLIGIASILIIYFSSTDLFVKLFGTDFFLRIDRLLDWSNKSGFQLENGMSAIGSAGLFGNGLSHIPVYFPEPQTDFIFAVYGSGFGFVGSLFLLCLLAYFDIHLIITAIRSNQMIDKYVMAGIVGMLLYQQLQNIGMTFGIMPITGITLPFISYGGSSLLSYMIMIGIIFNISNHTLQPKMN